MPRTFSKRTDLVIGLLYVVILVVFVAPVIPVGTANARLVNVFSQDEATCTNMVSRMIRDRTLSTDGFFYWPAFYFYVSAFFAFPFCLLWPAATETIAIIVLRVVCLGTAVGTLAVTYLFAKEVFDRRTALLAPGVLLASYSFWQWTATAHPDMLQMLLILLSMYYLYHMVALGYRQTDLILASVFAALAFGSKYAGLFLTPIICLAVLVATAAEYASSRAHQEDSSWAWRGLATTVLKRCVLAGAAFSIAFFVSNPATLTDFRTFARQMLGQSEHLSFGHVYAEPANGLLWFKVIGSSSMIGTLGIWFIAVGLATWTWQSYRERRELPGKTMGRALVLVWVLMFLGIMIARVNMRRPRMLFPIFPFLAMFSAHGLLYPLAIVEKPKVHKVLVYLVAIALCMLAALAWWPGVQRVCGYLGELRTKMETNLVVQAGEWLQQNVPQDAVIAFDVYSYIPPSFENIKSTWGQNWERILWVRPDVVVVNSSIMPRFSDPDKASVYRGGAEEYLAIHEFYKSLTEGTNPCYKPMVDFGEVMIYGLEPAACLETVEQGAR